MDGLFLSPIAAYDIGNAISKVPIPRSGAFFDGRLSYGRLRFMTKRYLLYRQCPGHTLGKRRF